MPISSESLMATSSGGHRSWALVGGGKNRVGQPSIKRLVVAELLKELSVVLQDSAHDSGQGFVVLDAGILGVVVLHGVLVGAVGGDSGRDVLRDQALHPVGIGPGDVPPL